MSQLHAAATKRPPGQTNTTGHTRLWPRMRCAPCRETYVQQEEGESPNDRNDRAIRVATQWYTKRLPSMKVHTLRACPQSLPPGRACAASHV